MKKILVVDDDRVSRSLLGEILRPAGYDVVEAEEGKQALKIVDADKIDLIITDRAMPGMDGMGLLQALRQRKTTIPTVVVSAFGEESMWGEAIGLGAQDYMLKPFAAQEVLKVVKKLLSKKASK